MGCNPDTPGLSTTRQRARTRPPLQPHGGFLPTVPPRGDSYFSRKTLGVQRLPTCHTLWVATAVQPAGAAGWVSPAQPWQLWNEHRGARTHPEMPHTCPVSQALNTQAIFCLSTGSQLGRSFLQEDLPADNVGYGPPSLPPTQSCGSSLSSVSLKKLCFLVTGSPCLSLRESLEREARLDWYIPTARHTVGCLLGPGPSVWPDHLWCCFCLEYPINLDPSVRPAWGLASGRSYPGNCLSLEVLGGTRKASYVSSRQVFLIWKLRFSQLWAWAKATFSTGVWGRAWGLVWASGCTEAEAEVSRSLSAFRAVREVLCE